MGVHGTGHAEGAPRPPRRRPGSRPWTPRSWWRCSAQSRRCTATPPPWPAAPTSCAPSSPSATTAMPPRSGRASTPGPSCSPGCGSCPATARRSPGSSSPSWPSGCGVPPGGLGGRRRRLRRPRPPLRGRHRLARVPGQGPGVEEGPEGGQEGQAGPPPEGLTARAGRRCQTDLPLPPLCVDVTGDTGCRSTSTRGCRGDCPRVGFRSGRRQAHARQCVTQTDSCSPSPPASSAASRPRRPDQRV